MKLGLMAAGFGPQIKVDVARIKEAEALGYDSVWTAEAWGSDAITPLAWIAAQTSKIKLGTAIMQMQARTPAMCAMQAMTVDQLSGGRMIVGIGPSGPQVIEGWHGLPYGKPLKRTREYIAVMRQIFGREKPVEFQGEVLPDAIQGRGLFWFGQAATQHTARPHRHSDLHGDHLAQRGRGRGGSRRRIHPGLDDNPKASRLSRRIWRRASTKSRRAARALTISGSRSRSTSW